MTLEELLQEYPDAKDVMIDSFGSVYPIARHYQASGVLHLVTPHQDKLTQAARILGQSRSPAKLQASLNNLKKITRIERTEQQRAESRQRRKEYARKWAARDRAKKKSS